jgi:hypothetical protein
MKSVFATLSLCVKKRDNVRIIGILITLVVMMWGKGEFVEKRYVYALDKTTIFKGSMTMDDTKTVVNYTHPEKKRLTQTGNTLTIDDLEAKSTQTVDLSKRLDMNMYFSFMRAVHKNDFSALKSYFDVTKEGNTLYLLPKGQAKRAIKSMEIKMSGSDMEKMTIDFVNGDMIAIQTL